MREDPGDDGGIGDHGDDPHQPLALGAAKRIDFKDPASSSAQRNRAARRDQSAGSTMARAASAPERAGA